MRQLIVHILASKLAACKLCTEVLEKRRRGTSQHRSRWYDFNEDIACTISADSPHNITRSSPGYELRSSHRGSILDLFSGVAYTFLANDLPDKRPPTA